MYRHPKDAMFRAADSSNGHGEKMFATLDLAEVDAVMHASPLSSFISAVKEESPSLSAGMFKAEEDFYADSDLDMNPLQHLEASTTTSDASDEKNATDSGKFLQSSDDEIEIWVGFVDKSEKSRVDQKKLTYSADFVMQKFTFAGWLCLIMFCPF